MWPYSVVSVSAHLGLPTDLSRMRFESPKWHSGFGWLVGYLWLLTNAVNDLDTSIIPFHAICWYWLCRQASNFILTSFWLTVHVNDCVVHLTSPPMQFGLAPTYSGLSSLSLWPPGLVSRHSVFVLMICWFSLILVYIPSYSVLSITFWWSESTSMSCLASCSHLWPPGSLTQCSAFGLPLPLPAWLSLMCS